MASRKRYIPSNSRTFNRLLKMSYGLFLRITYRVDYGNREVIRGLKPPYVLVANHVTTRDPFILASGCPEPVYWVTSDGNMRTSFMRFWLRRVGSIPKSKVIPDIETINWIVDVIRKRRGVVGIFPEGQASWDGHTLPLFPSTAKLLKILKVPVVAARIGGAYLSYPRWTWARRRGKVRVEWEVILRPEELKAMSPEEILARLEKGLAHDEYESQKKEMVEYLSRKRAEHLELALYMCPACEKVGSMRSGGKRFHCGACGSTWILDRFGFFRAAGKDRSHFATVRDWSLWQEDAFAAAVDEARSRPTSPFISDTGAVLLKGHRMNPLRRIRTGNLALYPDRLELKTLLGEVLVLPLPELDGIGVLKRNLLEFYQGKTLWQVRFARRSVSARKWANALALFKEGTERR